MTDQSDRRVLSFPAVHPCEGISPATLISSLISLSHNICTYQNTFFPTQRKNARESIRQVNIILIFLHEIHDRSLFIPESTVLTFSELHFTFQKLLFLLQDCSRQDERILMLAKSQHVASIFQSLIRSVATVLDVLLPLHNIGVCREVKELVELLSKQARKAKLEHDQKDELASKKLYSVLKQFEKGIEPEANALRGILDYIEIKTWTECNNEIKLLEKEIGFECSESNEKDIPLFYSLLGFMSYCRGVIFETLDFTFPLRSNNNNNSDQSSEARCSTEMITCVNPEDFRCPISLELMTDPVTVSTGQTYDRASIKKWLKAGNKICPKTGEKLENTDLVPNTTLKRLIQQFCNENGISISKSSNRTRDIARTILPGSSANAHALQFLSWFLTRRLVFGTEEQRNKSAYEIRVLARSNVFNRACLIEVGTIPPLLDLLSSDDKSTQENAISALLKLSKHATGPQNIMESNGLTPILNILKNGLTLEAKQVAAATIFYLASVKDYRKVIGENPEVIPALVDLVNEGTNCGKKNAVVAIYGLVLVPRNHRRAIEAGAVHALVQVLRSTDKDELVTECLAVLEKLAENVEGSHAILREPSVLSLVSGMLKTASSRAGKEHSASILLSLCVNVGAEVVAVLAKDPSLMSLLYSLLTDGTSHAAKKARFLIKVLQDFNETRASRVKCDSVTQEQSLHVW